MWRFLKHSSSRLNRKARHDIQGLRVNGFRKGNSNAIQDLTLHHFAYYELGLMCLSFWCDCSRRLVSLGTTWGNIWGKLFVNVDFVDKIYGENCGWLCWWVRPWWGNSRKREAVIFKILASECVKCFRIILYAFTF